MTSRSGGGHGQAQGRTHGQEYGLTDDIRRYWDQRGRHEGIVAHDGASRRSDFREHPVWLGVPPLLLAPSATGRPLRRIADMGCGTGILAEHLARLGYGVIAVEFAESRAALARQRLARYPNAEVRIGDAADPPIATGEVDAVLSRNLLWLLTDPLVAVARWRALVGTGGRVAAIDATRRLDRDWLATARNRASQLFGGWVGSAGKPISTDRATPLANVPDATTALDLWRSAGLHGVSAKDLSWVSAVKDHNKSIIAKAATRSLYYAVLGDA